MVGIAGYNIEAGKSRARKFAALSLKVDNTL